MKNMLSGVARCRRPAYASAQSNSAPGCLRREPSGARSDGRFTARVQFSIASENVRDRPSTSAGNSRSTLKTWRSAEDSGHLQLDRRRKQSYSRNHQATFDLPFAVHRADEPFSIHRWHVVHDSLEAGGKARAEVEGAARHGMGLDLTPAWRNSIRAYSRGFMAYAFIRGGSRGCMDEGSPTWTHLMSLRCIQIRDLGHPARRSEYCSTTLVRVPSSSRGMLRGGPTASCTPERVQRYG